MFSLFGLDPLQECAILGLETAASLLVLLRLRRLRRKRSDKNTESPITETRLLNTTGFLFLNLFFGYNKTINDTNYDN